MNASPPTVLLIDDEGWTRTVTAASLTTSGRFRVVEAGSAAEGLDLAIRDRPDCILLDVVLPDAQGPDVLRRLRSSGVDRCPIVFVTTLSDDGQFQRLMDVGANAVLRKPVDLVRLPIVLEEILRVHASAGSVGPRPS
ncbi:MAG: response regulator [Blastocatellia bacterium]|nr:response regulator [Blastocatellia bacterium]MBK6425075.1 response regulator [Blastocatellia bacterium]